MITAWQIYLVLQLDSIDTFFFVATVAAVMAPLIVGMMSEGEAVWNDETKRLRRWAKWTLILSPVLLVCGVLTPSTKTAAAMVVLPAIVNNEALQSEAGDLYRLAKKALSDAVGDEPEAKE